MTTNGDTIVCRVAQPCAHTQKALGFIAVPLVLVITPLSDITNKKSHATQMNWARVTMYKEILHL
jgi:thioesterase domain-containing protein